jgi:hypothetical protein
VTGKGTTVQAYPGVHRFRLWTFGSCVGASVGEMNDTECRRAKLEGANIEGRQGTGVAGGLTGEGEPGATRAAQADIADIVLERRRVLVRTGVGGCGTLDRVHGEGGWARKS